MDALIGLAVGSRQLIPRAIKRVSNRREQYGSVLRLSQDLASKLGVVRLYSSSQSSAPWLLGSLRSSPSDWVGSSLLAIFGSMPQVPAILSSSPSSVSGSRRIKDAPRNLFGNWYEVSSTHRRTRHTRPPGNSGGRFGNTTPLPSDVNREANTALYYYLQQQRMFSATQPRYRSSPIAAL